MEGYQNTHTLDGPSIDSFSESLGAFLERADVERQNIIRIRLSLEEALLRMRDFYGEAQQVRVHFAKKTRRIVIQLDTEGNPFNPLSSDENRLEDLCGSLLTAVGLSPQYSYSGRSGTLRLVLPLPGINPVLKILAAVLIGSLVGWLGNLFIQDTLRTSIVTNVMLPINEVWRKMLNILSGPVIFFMVITTILNTSKIAESGGKAWKIAARYFLLSFAVGGAALAAARIFIPMELGVTMSAGREAQGILQVVLDLVPENFFAPFMESNTPQLLVIAAVIGAALNIIGSDARYLRKIIRQANMVGLKLADWASRLVPFFLAVLIAMQTWLLETNVLKGLWKCLLTSFILSVGCIFVIVLYVSFRESVSAVTLMRKLWNPFVMTLRTGSLNSSYGLVERTSASRLGIARSFTVIGLPNGLVLYMPIGVIGTITFMTFAAMKFHVATSPVWYVLVVILTVLLTVATPPVPGASLLAYVALFARFGIPGDALTDAMIFEIIFGLFASAANQLLLQTDLILQAGKLGMLDREKLRSPFN